MKQIQDLTGNQYGRLTALRFYERKGTLTKWLCLCECGAQKLANAIDLKSGKTKSCGCLNAEVFAALITKHGDHGSKEYIAWKAMKQRCTKNPKKKVYKYYAGRGISICAKWLRSYSAFLSDMGRAPSPELTVDRINNDGNYEPGNCRWATYLQQNNNRRVAV